MAKGGHGLTAQRDEHSDSKDPVNRAADFSAHYAREPLNSDPAGHRDSRGDGDETVPEGGT